MKKILWLPLVFMVLSGCFKQADIIGTWIQPIPGMEDQQQGILIEKGGRAVSVNMATLQYESWKQEGDMLILSGKSIGNGQTLDFSDAYKIVRLTDSELVLQDGGALLSYKRK